MSRKPWGGRFQESTSREVERFTESISFDWRLYAQDIRGSQVHARILARAGVLSQEEAEALCRELEKIQQEMEAGTFPLDPSLEDIHMHIERRLLERLGPVGEKLHTGRSRNDQVVLDLRLYIREALDRVVAGIREVQRALVEAAKQHLGLYLPGYTHLQRAQVVLLSHHLLAYWEMLERDRQRFLDARPRINVYPLGSGALAGTPYPLDREYGAQELGFEGISRNSLDAVSDRDFVLEFLAASAILMMHLSRFSEDLILWTSQEFGFVDLPDSVCTGSSMMPQKKNPDVLELIRGKTGRVYGHLMALLTVLKGLPLAYNRDLQEDKEPLFDTVETLDGILAVLPGVIRGMRPRAEVMAQATREGFLWATDMADYLVQKGVPFRSAHEIVGRVVRYCVEKGLSLEALDLETLRTFSPAFEQDVFARLTPEAMVAARGGFGGTAPSAVEARIREIEEQMGW